MAARSRPSSPTSTNLIPDEILEATARRLREARDSFPTGDPLHLPARVLRRTNDADAIEGRLEAKGVSKPQARAAARAVVAAPIRTWTEGSLALDNVEGLPDFDAHDELLLERTIGANDLVDVRFLLKGSELSASVGRIRLGRGFATGFVVAPGVLMTNWHVFRRESDARGAKIEFGLRELEEGGPLSVPTVYDLDTDRLFFHDRRLDVAVVAIGARVSGEIDVDSLPPIRLAASANAVLRGERVNVIQHPGGEPKQVALRDNTVFEIVDGTFLQYRADTQRGSSGSPVFNEEWELVALHHSGVPRTDDQGRILAIDGRVWQRSMGDHRIDWIANEGILTPALRELLGSQSFGGEAKALVDRVLEESVHQPSRPRPVPVVSVVAPKAEPGGGQDSSTQRRSLAAGAEVEIPLTVTVRVSAAQVADLPGNRRAPTERADFLVERFSIDRDYSNRGGYDDAFLAVALSRPGLTDEQEGVVARNREASGDDDPLELPYHNFSVVMNGERRLCFYTAVNIDGTRMIRIPRDDEGGETSWITDDRIGDHEQADNRFYRGRRNRLDRGHVVRRLDPAWGDSEEQSARGILDTFHYTNSTPQYDTFNRGSDRRRREEDRLWLALEEFVLDNAETEQKRISVFAGPVFRDQDPDFMDQGLQIPQEYWKIVAWVDGSGELQSAAFLLSQKRFLDRDTDIEAFEADFRDRELFQTDVATLAKRTRFDFGPLARTPTCESLTESFERSGRGVPVASLRDIRLR